MKWGCAVPFSTGLGTHPRSQQKTKTLRLFPQSMDDMNDSLRSLSSLAVGRMRSVARRLYPEDERRTTALAIRWQGKI